MTEQDYIPDWWIPCRKTPASTRLTPGFNPVKPGIL